MASPLDNLPDRSVRLGQARNLSDQSGVVAMPGAGSLRGGQRAGRAACGAGSVRGGQLAGRAACGAGSLRDGQRAGRAACGAGSLLQSPPLGAEPPSRCIATD
jgi:hypothetical protein